MDNEQIRKLINDVGMKIFVKYYNVFKQGDRAKAIECITESFTEKSKGTRTSNAMKIFDEKLNLEVLELIASSKRAEDWVIKKAQELLKLER